MMRDIGYGPFDEHDWNKCVAAPTCIQSSLDQGTRSNMWGWHIYASLDLIHLKITKGACHTTKKGFEQSRYSWSLDNHYVLLDTSSDGPDERVSFRAANESRSYGVTRKERELKHRTGERIWLRKVTCIDRHPWGIDRYPITWRYQSRPMEYRSIPHNRTKKRWSPSWL